MTKKNVFLWRALLFFGLFLLTVFFLKSMGIRINTTASMPLGIWRVRSLSMPVKTGDIVLVCLNRSPVIGLAHHRDYIAEGNCPSGLEPLLKPVVAIAGDFITVSTVGVSVNGQLIPNSQVVGKDLNGQYLPSFLRKNFRMPPNEVLLISSFNPASFDSRYFGTVPAGNIIGLATPVWVGHGYL